MRARIFKFIFCLMALAPFTLLIYANYTVSSNQTLTHSSTHHLPTVKACLVLGTSKLLANGNLNSFYIHRIDATVAVFSSGKCSTIIVSGDNQHIDYNEPADMKKSLVERGISPDVIYCDYAGGRTLDSVLRFKHIFGQSSGIVISQAFHNERAIYIGKHNGIKLSGFNAADVDAYHGFLTQFREIFSRARAVIDVKILHSTARHAGQAIQL